MQIRTDNGKYTFDVAKDGAVSVLRHGEPWVENLDAPNAVFSLLCELDAARVVLEAARKMGGAVPDELRAALGRHAALVDDREPPSEWTESA